MEVAVMSILSGFDGAAEFNYFFSLVVYFGAFAFALGCLVRVLSRS